MEDNTNKAAVFVVVVVDVVAVVVELVDRLLKEGHKILFDAVALVAIVAIVVVVVGKEVYFDNAE